VDILIWKILLAVEKVQLDGFFSEKSKVIGNNLNSVRSEIRETY
jgi:hypothetical protein